MKIGIIGFGRFGTLTAHYLAKDFDVFVSTRNSKQREIRKTGAQPASFEFVCSLEIIIICVPISAMESTLKKMKKPLLRNKNAIVVDVCSVKEYPVSLMKKYLPKHVHILATHPIFGPDSAKDSLKGRRIMIHPTKLPKKKYNQIKSYLKKKKLDIIEMTPSQHDKEIANSLFLTHFIGRSLNAFGARKLTLDTEGYSRLLSVLEMVENDSMQLFQDMDRFNQYTKKVRKKFLTATGTVNRRLE